MRIIAEADPLSERVFVRTGAPMPIGQDALAFYRITIERDGRASSYERRRIMAEGRERRVRGVYTLHKRRTALWVRSDIRPGQSVRAEILLGHDWQESRPLRTEGYQTAEGWRWDVLVEVHPGAVLLLVMAALPAKRDKAQVTAWEVVGVEWGAEPTVILEQRADVPRWALDRVRWSELDRTDPNGNAPTAAPRWSELAAVQGA